MKGCLKWFRENLCLLLVVTLLLLQIATFRAYNKAQNAIALINEGTYNRVEAISITINEIQSLLEDMP